MFFKRPCLGIDLRADRIKVAYLAKAGNRSRVYELYQIQNPVGKVVFENQKEQDAIRRIMSTIKQKFPKGSVIMGIPSHHVVYRHVNFPLLNRKELREAISWEMQEFNTIFSDDYVSDYEILEEKNNICRVLLVAVPKSLAMLYANILRGAGFYIKAFDVYPLAYARVINTLNRSGVSAIIDTSYEHSEIAIVERGKLILNRNLDLHKNSTSEQVLMEVSKIFDFYSLQSKNNQIDDIILLETGGRLKDLFESYFNVNVYADDEIQWNLIAEKLPHAVNPIDYICAIGFAMRG